MSNNRLPRTSRGLPPLSDYHRTGLVITLNQPTSCRPLLTFANMLQLTANGIRGHTGRRAIPNI
jgi:hypothetical protein